MIGQAWVLEQRSLLAGWAFALGGPRSPPVQVCWWAVQACWLCPEALPKGWPGMWIIWRRRVCRSGGRLEFNAQSATPVGTRGRNASPGVPALPR